MAKKIRVIEEEQTEEELSTQEFQSKMLEYMHTMDWKLWEMLKIMQSMAEKNGISSDAIDDNNVPEETGQVETAVIEKKERVKKGPKPVIVDEDDE